MAEETKTFSKNTIIYLIVAVLIIIAVIAIAQMGSKPSTTPNSANTNSTNSSQNSSSVVMMVTQLTGASEVPPVSTSATGSGTFTVNTQNNTIAFSINFSGLSAAETGAHIHGPANVGANAGVLFPLPAGNSKTGTINYLEAQEADILAGRTYVNIHSATFPAGEIRGWIVRQ